MLIFGNGVYRRGRWYQVLLLVLLLPFLACKSMSLEDVQSYNDLRSGKVLPAFFGMWTNLHSAVTCRVGGTGRILRNDLDFSVGTMQIDVLVREIGETMKKSGTDLVSIGPEKVSFDALPGVRLEVKQWQDAVTSYDEAGRAHTNYVDKESIELPDLGSDARFLGALKDLADKHGVDSILTLVQYPHHGSDEVAYKTEVEMGLYVRKGKDQPFRSLEKVRRTVNLRFRWDEGGCPDDPKVLPNALKAALSNNGNADTMTSLPVREYRTLIQQFDERFTASMKEAADGAKR